MRTRLAAGLLALVFAAPAAADLDGVRSCVASNSPKLSSKLGLSLAVRTADGAVRFESRFELLWRRLPDGEQRVLLRFTEPEDLAGAALLIRVDPGGARKVHIYLPDLGEPRGILSRGELEGFLGQANLGIEELELLLDPVGGRNLRVLDDAAERDQRPGWQLERSDDRSDSRFARTVLFIDREFCVPLRAEFYARDDAPQKTLRIDPARVERTVDSWTPRELVFLDARDGSETTLRVERVEVDSPFSPSLLTVNAMRKPGP